jgi:hypothetical protein
MKKKLFLASLFVLIGMFFSEKSFAQQVITETTFDSASTYILKLRDESQLVGKYLGRDSLNVIIKTASMPRVEVPISNVVSVSKVEAENFRHGKYWFPNPNATRYLFSPSAFCLKEGEGYYQNTYLFLNSFNVGLSDHVTIGGGLEFISTFASIISGEGGPIFYVTPKVGFEVAPKVNLGAGLLYVSIPDFGEDYGRSGGGIFYGLSTFGNTNSNLTTGLGWGYFKGDVGSSPFITISGMTRISRKTALVTENWLIPSGSFYAVYSYGFRFFGEKLAVDLAFINNRDIASGLLIGLPYVDFVVKF